MAEYKYTHYDFNDGLNVNQQAILALRDFGFSKIDRAAPGILKTAVKTVIGNKEMVVTYKTMTKAEADSFIAEFPIKDIAIKAIPLHVAHDSEPKKLKWIFASSDDGLAVGTLEKCVLMYDKTALDKAALKYNAPPKEMIVAYNQKLLEPNRDSIKARITDIEEALKECDGAKARENAVRLAETLVSVDKATGHSDLDLGSAIINAAGLMHGNAADLKGMHSHLLAIKKFLKEPGIEGNLTESSLNAPPEIMARIRLAQESGRGSE